MLLVVGAQIVLTYFSAFVAAAPCRRSACVYVGYFSEYGDRRYFSESTFVQPEVYETFEKTRLYYPPATDTERSYEAEES